MSDAKQLRLDHKIAVTARISETSRFVGFGIVAWLFAVNTSESSFAAGYVESYKFWLNVAGIAGFLTIVADYLQYLAAYFSVNRALEREHDNYKFDHKHFAYLAQRFLFWAKQAFAVVGSVLVSITFALNSILH